MKRHDHSRGLKHGALIALVLATLAPCAIFAQTGRSPDPNRVLQEADKALYPDAYRARIRMTTEKPGSKTELLADQVYQAGLGSRLEILEPTRSKGIRYLQRDEGLWMWSPRSGSSRPLRLPAKESFQGSAFSNDDVSETRYATRYDASLAGNSPVSVDGKEVDCLIIEARAKSPSSPYGKLVLYIAVEGGYPLRIDYYSRSQVLYKRMSLSELAPLAGRVRPRTMRMEQLDGSGTITTVRLESLSEEQNLSPRLFSLSDLGR